LFADNTGVDGDMPFLERNPDCVGFIQGVKTTWS
jgi:hypothetical protein